MASLDHIVSAYQHLRAEELFDFDYPEPPAAIAIIDICPVCSGTVYADDDYRQYEDEDTGIDYYHADCLTFDD